MNIKKLLRFTFFPLLITTFLSGCVQRPLQDGPPRREVDVSKIPDAVPKVEPCSRYGNPVSYVVRGRRYHVLDSAHGYDKVGLASWYGTKFHHHLTSTREPYDMFTMTAASRDLPLPTYAAVTNLNNGRRVIVKINDRGPFNEHRIIDLSYAAAKKLGYVNQGTARVRVTAIEMRPSHSWNAVAPQHMAPIPTEWTKTPQHHGGYFLQIGAFSRTVNADALRKRLQRITAPVQVALVSDQLKHLYRVLVGPLATTTEFKRLQARLQAHGWGGRFKTLKV